MLRTLFVFAILLPGLAYALRNRYAALLLYLWYSLFRPQDWIWTDINWMRLSLVLSLLVVIPWDWLRAGTRQQAAGPARTIIPPLTHPLIVGMVLFLAAAVIANGQAVNAELSERWLDYLWRLLLIAVVASKLVNTRERFVLAVTVMAISLGFHSTKAGIMSTLRGGARILDGLGGSYVDNNGYAMAVVMILFLLVAAAQNTKFRWARLALYAMVVPSALAVMYTFSRAGFLSLVVAGVTFLMFQRHRVVTLLGLTAVGGVLLLFVPSGYTDRLQTIQTYEEVGETSALSRLHFWKVAIVMAEAHPLGVGLRNYDVVYDRYDSTRGLYGSKRSVHNSHLQVLAEMGYFGFAVYVGMFAVAAWLVLRARARSRLPGLPPETQRFLATMSAALMASLTGFVIGGSFIALALNDLTWIIFGLIVAFDRLGTQAVQEAAALARQAAVPVRPVRPAVAVVPARPVWTRPAPHGAEL
jgi:probable O-glycosylation ligase (exosortase A-associated)